MGADVVENGLFKRYILRITMDTEGLINFFRAKLEKVPEVKSLNNKGNPEFIKWWNTVRSTCERMGESYRRRADSIRFYPGMVVAGSNEGVMLSQAYHRGMDEAEAFIESIIEELELWGYESNTANADVQTSLQDRVVLNLTITQQQVQQITQTINLSQYDTDVQEKVKELLNELKKESKDKPAIVSAVKWLADKGIDALIAVLLAAAHLT